MDDFHVTRLEWTYLRHLLPSEAVEEEQRRKELQLVARVRETGRLFGGASNSFAGVIVAWDSTGGRNHRYEHTIVDRSGGRPIPGHKQGWAKPTLPGCMNDPVYRQNHLAYLRAYVAAGAEMMQRDEPPSQHVFAKSGAGCFCRYCMAGFREFLRENASPKELRGLGVINLNSFSYREYLNEKSPPVTTDSFDWSDPATIPRLGGKLHQMFVRFQEVTTVRFFRWIREELSTANGGRPVPYSCNNSSFQKWEEEYYHLFDYGMSEMMRQSANPRNIYERAQAAMQLGKVQVFGTPKTMGEDYDPRELALLKRRVIATAYASGGLACVPWDVFLQSKDGNDRYFGTPQEYADLFGLVRASHRWLDGYCSAGAWGPDLKDNSYGSAFPVAIESRSDVCIFLRSIPGDNSAPVIVHLVNWGSGAERLRVVLRKESFGGNGKLSATLVEPRPYEPGAHGEAERKAQAMRLKGERMGAAQAIAYESLVRMEAVPTTERQQEVLLDLPSPTPWSFLIIQRNSKPQNNDGAAGRGSNLPPP
jgi:hypothetical protein